MAETSQTPSSAPLFSVAEYYYDGTWSYAAERITGADAVRKALDRSRTPAAVTGLIARIIITDGDDFTVFDWRHDQGVVWPTPKDIAANG